MARVHAPPNTAIERTPLSAPTGRLLTISPVVALFPPAFVLVRAPVAARRPPQAPPSSLSPSPQPVHRAGTLPLFVPTLSSPMLLPTRTLSVSSAFNLIPPHVLSIVRQQTPSSTVQSNQRSVWIIVCVVLAVLLFVVVTLLVVRLMLRTRHLSATPLEDAQNGTAARHADRERLVFAYLPAQAPAIVRMQRLAKKAGLSTQELDSVAPVSPYSRQASDSSHLDANKSGDHVCAVCLEDMVDGSNTRRLPCGHWFDADCIDVWATKANRCPVCNANIVDEEELERRRLGTFEAADHSVRQRRRRTRGENGTFELAIVDEHNFLASERNASSGRAPPQVVNESP